MADQINAHTDQQQQQQQHEPGLMAGHAEYLKGVAESGIGTITGSQAWSSSGEQDKVHATSNLRAAAEARDPAKQGYGKVEEIAGRVLGCEGMKKEGIASARKGQ
ncbi:hypothetical protein SODALDRAFT_350302 [Sodiomyces alkalinus F11]|uniref:CsbD-like domain-containing protein n=1 Tax=Sodiomyces alkalinus (strain CBS 110278 / VKM F-3762 / F11) TaxID=1314773 RepID=A0A3N2PX04_SODAK|nr:hypothetical protein SODALDRAFT_350302 [Sodiomyces alkalinus F11]ROT39051.1 hypothetical protein SODALDRAFT_350302 [Sodiomyces alkalinus F11]